MKTVVLLLVVTLMVSCTTGSFIPVSAGSVVSYKFVGVPGTVFQYTGSSYTIPSGGSIELLAVFGASCKKNGRPVRLDRPTDQFGMITVKLPP